VAVVVKVFFVDLIVVVVAVVVAVLVVVIIEIVVTLNCYLVFTSQTGCHV